MEAVKVIGYVIIAIALITAFFMGSALIVVIGIVCGILLNLATGILFAAKAVKELFERSENK